MNQSESCAILLFGILRLNSLLAYADVGLLSLMELFYPIVAGNYGAACFFT